jgi:hypothetical protein
LYAHALSQVAEAVSMEEGNCRQQLWQAPGSAQQVDKLADCVFGFQGVA